MPDRFVKIAFVFSLLGAIYQLISLGLAYYVDRQLSYFVFIGLGTYVNSFDTLIVFWSIAHLMDERDSRRTTWPAILMGIGVANLTNLIIAWVTPINTGGFPVTTQTLPLDLGLTLLPAPLLLILGGIFGFIAARRVRRAAAVISSLSSSQ